MPEIGRAQLVGYALAALVIVGLGVRYMHNQAAAASSGQDPARSQAAVPPESGVVAGGAGGGGGDGQAETEGGDRQAETGGGDGQATTADGTVRIEAAGGGTALVHVAGAVRHPGVYKLRAGARVEDAVRRAGGGARAADVNAINLAAKVADGQQIVVPRRPSSVGASAGAGGGASASAAGGSGGQVSAAGAGGAGASTGPPAAPVNLNTATIEELDTLDGVGPATAQKIIDYRQQHGGFRSVDDLAEVPGIGPKKLAALRDKVQV